MAAIDPTLLAFGLTLASFGVLPAVMALRAEHRREARGEQRHAAAMAQLAAIVDAARQTPSRISASPSP